MRTEPQKQSLEPELKKEIMLQINRRLYDTGVISQEVYQRANLKIVSGT